MMVVKVAGSGTEGWAYFLEGESKLMHREEGKFQGKGRGRAVVHVELIRGGAAKLREVNAEVISCHFLSD